MDAPTSPIGSRRRLGAELRRLRGRSGLTLHEVAALMTCSTSKISRLETGKAVPKVPDVSELMRIYGVASDTERDMLLRLVSDGREQGWWVPYTDALETERFMMSAPDRYAALESEATSVTSFDVGALYGLVQTPAYTRAVLAAVLPDRDPDEVERLVEFRGRRQEALTRATAPLRLTMVVDESVLHRPAGSPAVMAEQLTVLGELSRRPNVTVRVFPFAAGFHRAHAGQLVLLEFADDAVADVVYLEGHSGDTYLEEAPDVELYRGVLDDIHRRALDRDESLSVIARWASIHASSEGEK
jgi:transcriptional regulator with XRE-family HTH domain